VSSRGERMRASGLLDCVVSRLTATWMICSYPQSAGDESVDSTKVPSQAAESENARELLVGLEEPPDPRAQLRSPNVRRVVEGQEEFAHHRHVEQHRGEPIDTVDIAGDPPGSACIGECLEVVAAVSGSHKLAAAEVKELDGSWLRLVECVKHVIPGNPRATVDGIELTIAGMTGDVHERSIIFRNASNPVTEVISRAKGTVAQIKAPLTRLKGLEVRQNERNFSRPPPGALEDVAGGSSFPPDTVRSLRHPPLDSWLTPGGKLRAPKATVSFTGLFGNANEQWFPPLLSKLPPTRRVT
jgi:hypothetical protein